MHKVNDDIPGHSIEREDIFPISFGEELNFNFGADIEQEENPDMVGLPGAWGTYSGDLRLLQTENIQNPWQEIRPVLGHKNFRTLNGRAIDALERVLNKRANNGRNYTCIDPNLSEVQDFDKPSENYSVYNLEAGVNISDTAKGILYTKQALAIGMPVVFGVNCMPYLTDDIEDQSTNHYVLVVGMGHDSRNYFEAWDLGASFPHLYLENGSTYDGGISAKNRLYLRSDWPGLISADERWSNSFALPRNPYIITRIYRTYPLAKKTFGAY